MHDGMPYGRNQGQGHSREVDRQSPTGLIFLVVVFIQFLGNHFSFYFVSSFSKLLIQFLYSSDAIIFILFSSRNILVLVHLKQLLVAVSQPYQLPLSKTTLWKGFCAILHFRELHNLNVYLCFNLADCCTDFICYVFHIVEYCCTLYHFNR